jgi:carbamoyltransferase
MNSVENGKIIKKTPYTHIYVSAASGDAGGAIGAAFYVYSKKNQGSDKYFEMDHAYWGPSYTNSYHKNLLDRNLSKIEKLFCSIEYINDENQLCDKVADAIAKGLVIGWFQGRMEWGPRALGNRSILGDPRRENMKDILNLKIKRRESFRPFAPSILLEKVYEWFEDDADVPFMSQVFQIRKDKQKKVPAVTHVDGSGRLQTVSLKTNPLYYKLISAFADKTGIPILLNTSFNENEPIVCSPEEALETFFRTKMDLLVLGNWIVKRK